MKVVASAIFRVIQFPHQGNIVRIDELDYSTPDLRANPSTNVPFVGESSGGYENVNIGMFKDPFLMGIFPFCALDTTHISLINMIFSSTNESLRSVDPWVVPHPEDVDSYGSFIPLIMVEIVDPTIPLTYIDTSQQHHLHVECDQPSLPIRVVESLKSHDFLDTKLPSKEAILEVMASIDNPKEEKNHLTLLLPDLGLMRVNTMSLDLRLGALPGTSNRPPSFDPFSPRLSFSELATKFSAIPHIEDLCFVLPHVFMDPIKELP
jgi:hypothetical protein